MVELDEIAARLDTDEKLKLTYRCPVIDGAETTWQVRTDRLLDVAEESGLLFVDRDGTPVWVKVEEAIEVKADAG